MNSPPNTASSQPPEALHLALAQITDVLKESGHNRLRASTDDDDGYRQLIWMLERLSKATLEWREHAQRSPDNLPSSRGMSPETERHVQRALEDMH